MEDKERKKGRKDTVKNTVTYFLHGWGEGLKITSSI